MKKTMYGIMWAVLTLAAACTAETDNLPATGGEHEISLQTSIQATTRAPQQSEDGSGMFSDGDTFKLLVSDGQGGMSDFDYTVGTTQLYWRDVTLGENTRQVTFAACYPPQALTDGTFVFDLQQASDRDLLLARQENVPVFTEQPVMLNFRHTMFRLIIRYAIDGKYFEGKEEEIVTECTAVSACKVNLTDGTLDSSSFPKGTFTVQGAKADLLLMPQQAADISLTVKVGKETYQTTLDKLMGEDKLLESGKKLSLNLTVKDGSLTLGGFTIDGWGEQGSIDEDIIM